MNKILQWMFLLVLIGVMGTAQGQGGIIYSCDFEDDNDTLEWTMSDGFNRWTIGNGTATTEGGKSLYVSNDDSSYHYGYNAYNHVCISYAYCVINVVDAKYVFTYDWKCTGDVNRDFMRVALVPMDMDISMVINSDISRYLPEGCIALDRGEYMSGSRSWYNESYEINVTEGQYKLVVIWHNVDDDRTNQGPGAIDNIVVTEVCEPPSDIIVVNKSGEEFTLRWNNHSISSFTSWSLEYGNRGFRRGEGTLVTDIMSPNYTISGLERNTVYDVYVWSNCSGDAGGDATKIRVCTDYSYVDLPYSERFDDYDIGEFPDFWRIMDGEGSVQKRDRDNKNIVLSRNGCVVMPKIAVPEWGVAMEFYGASSSNYLLEVGYVTSVSRWDYHPLRKLNGDNGFRLYHVDLSGLEEMPDSCYFVFKMLSDVDDDRMWRIDNISIFALNEVDIPYDVQFRNFNVMDSTVTISWNCDTEGANFEVMNYFWRDTAMVDVEGADSVTLHCFISSSYVRIRAILDGVASAWSEAFFITIPMSKSVSIDNLHVENVSSTSVDIVWNTNFFGYSDTNRVVDGYLFRYRDPKKCREQVYIDSIYIDSEVGTRCRVTGLTSDTVYYGELYYMLDGDTIYSCYVDKFKACEVTDNRLWGGDYEKPTLLVPNYEKYGFMQTIYPSNGTVGLSNITGISFHNDWYNYSLWLMGTRYKKVYIGFTDKYRFDEYSDYIDTADMELVFEGEYTYFGNLWQTINFDHPVTVDHNKNVVICVFDSAMGEMPSALGHASHYGTSICGTCNGESPYPIDNRNWSIYGIHRSPDITFKGTSCEMTGRNPRLNSVVPGHSCMSYGWDKLGSESAWTVSYRKWGERDWIVAEDSISEQNYVLMNLCPYVPYEVRIGSLCGGDTLYTYSIDYTLNGLCHVPYREVYVGNNSYNRGMGENVGIRQRIWVRSGDYLEVPTLSSFTLQEFDAPVNELMLTFGMDSHSTSCSVVVGVCDDMSDFSTFVPVDTLVYDCMNPDRKISVALDGYTGAGNFIGMKVLSGQFCIDTMWVDYIQGCIAPNSLRVTDVSRNRIDVAWNGVGAQAWRATIVEWGEDVSEGVTIDCATPKASFTGLLSGMSYDIYVHSVCDDEVSEDVIIRETTLGCEPVKLPFEINFDDDDLTGCWKSVIPLGDNEWIPIGRDVTGVMFIKENDNATMDERTIALSCIPIEVERSGKCSFSFDWKIDGAADENRFCVALAPITCNFSAISADQYKKEHLPGWIYLNDENLTTSEWNNMSGNIIVPEGVYYLVLLYDHMVIPECNSHAYCAMVDNIEMGYANCGDNGKGEAFLITDHSAVLSWETIDRDVESWEVKLNDGQKIITTENYCELEGLNGGMPYEATIRSMCGEEEYGMPIKVRFETECGEIVRFPYYNDFELDSNGTEPHCWTKVQGECFVKDGVFKCAIANDLTENLIIALPMLADDIDFSNVKLIVDACDKNDNEFDSRRYIRIFMTDDLNDRSSYVYMEDLYLEYDMQRYETWLYSVEPKRYIGLSLGVDETVGLWEDKYILIDNLAIVKRCSCEYPLDAHVDMVGWDFITVSWDSEVEQSEWEVKIIDEHNQEMDRIVVTEPTYTFTGLENGAEYRIAVRAICTEDVYGSPNYGYWSSVNVMTQCGVVNDIRVTDITEDSVKVSWTPCENQTQWSVVYGERGFYPNHLEKAMSVNTTEPEVVLSGLTNGMEYELYVKAACGDNNSSMSMPVYFTATNGVGIDGIEGDYQFLIYPNPTSGTTTISLSGVAGEVDISVIDVNGRMIINETMNCDDECEKRLDVEGLTQGMYFVRVFGDRINSVRKLIVR